MRYRASGRYVSRVSMHQEFVIHVGLVEHLRRFRQDGVVFFHPSSGEERTKRVHPNRKSLLSWRDAFAADGNAVSGPLTPALLIADALGKQRAVSQYLPIGELFDTLVAGLAINPGLLDSHDKAGGNENDDDQ